jgi:uncharacterized protein
MAHCFGDFPVFPLATRQKGESIGEGGEAVKDALYIIARAPRAGFAKTRLAADIGDERAIALYKAFLADLAARFSKCPFPLGWYVTPPDGWGDISGVVGGSERILFQGEGDLTRRQRDLFVGAGERGEGRVVLMAADSPQIGVEVVEEAFRLLDERDVVFGPTYDGGYYLIAMSRPHDVFEGPMSTGTELADVMARAERNGLSVGLLDATFDIDVADDLRHLVRHALDRPDLAATRAALEALGMMEDLSENGVGDFAGEA